MNLIRFHKPGYMLSMNSLFNDVLNESTYMGSRFINNQTTAVNIIENEKAFELELLAPGFEKDNFSITNKDGVLNIKAELNGDENQKVNYTQKRFSIEPFERAFNLPDNVDIEGISAKYSNGILTVELPKKEIHVENTVTNITIQ